MPGTHSRIQVFLTLSVVAILACPTVGTASGGLLQAGPMVGHVTAAEAAIWLRIKQGAAVSGVALQGDRSHRHASLTDLDDGFFLVQFSGLAPAAPTRVRLEITRADRPAETTQVSFRTTPTPGRTGRVRIAFGSCSKLSEFDGAPIYHSLAKERPDCMLYLGDNAYFIVADGSENHFSTTGPRGDWSFEESMTARHLVTRVHPDLQPALHTIPSYAIWDDHDYGPNNADREFPLKEEALRAFRQVWANPAWGTPETPGIFSRFRLGPVEIFLMDDRYYKYSPQRHDDVSVETGEIWGPRQTQWLLDGLKNSSAPVKIIANGTQVLSSEMRGEGHHQEARAERRRLFEFLAGNRIGGVVFLSGDRHYSEAMQWRQPDGPLIVEGTSSPLQQGQRTSHFTRAHDNQLWAMSGNSYGLVTVDIPEEGHGTVTFETRDESNSVPMLYGEPRSTTWTLDQLTYQEGKDGESERPVGEDTWSPLFHGENLEGWVRRNGAAEFRVDKGVIVGRTVEGSPNSFLCTEREFADFELMFDVLLVDEELNSGVQLRSESDPDYKQGRVHGPQVEIASSPGDAGYVYSEGTERGWLGGERPKNVFRNGEWNHYYVRARGSRIQTWINGIAVADLDEDELSPRGFIALQVHGIRPGTGPYEVQWRNLHIRELRIGGEPH